MSRLVRLYPKAWRARYGDELEDLVASRGLAFSDAVDLVRGAVDAHRHPELVDPAIAPASELEPVSRQRHHDLVVARRLGTGSLFGAALWIFAWVVATNGPVIGTGDGAYVDGMAAVPIFLAAMLLLGAGLAGHMIRLPARARMARIGAVVAIVCGPLWAFGPWIFILGLLTVAGIASVALEGWWTSSWSGAAMLGLMVSIAGTTVSALTAFGLMAEAPMVGFVLFATPIWLFVGATLQTVPEANDVEPDRPREEPASESAPA